MELILKETIDTLGEMGDIVKVKPGYGRNYLIPRKLAAPANKSNLALLEQQRAAIQGRKEKQRQEAEGLAKKIAGATVIIEARVGGEDKLFGSITGADIAEKLGELGIVVDKRKILLENPIKTLGETLVTIKVGYQVDATIKVQVVPLANQG